MHNSHHVIVTTEKNKQCNLLKISWIAHRKTRKRAQKKKYQNETTPNEMTMKYFVRFSYA